MNKHPRNSIQIVQDNDFYIINADTKKYKISGSNVRNFICDSRIDVSIIHNFERKAMLDFIDAVTGESVGRIEINPFQYYDVEDWVVDN